MFVETVTAPGDVWRHWTDRLRLLTDPTAALFASIAWDNGDGTISGVNVRDNPRPLPTSSRNVSSRRSLRRERHTTNRFGMVSPLLPTSVRRAPADRAVRLPAGKLAHIGPVGDARSVLRRAHRPG
jgi:hypothetical protein